MEPPIFYAPPESFSGNLIQLPAFEAHHAQAVMRLRVGEIVVVVDGTGMAHRGEFKPTGKQAHVAVHQTMRNFGEPTVRLTLAAGLSTGSKFDEVVEKGTELGVSRFVPVVTGKSKVRVEDPSRAKGKQTRLEKVALAAMKQCRRSYRPEISMPVTLRQFLADTDDEAWKLIFHPADSARPIDELELPVYPKRVTILIGPESGFAPDEYAAATDKGYVPVSLGKRILRTENAGPVAAALVMHRLGEFR